MLKGLAEGHPVQRVKTVFLDNSGLISLERNASLGENAKETAGMTDAMMSSSVVIEEAK